MFTREGACVCRLFFLFPESGTLSKVTVNSLHLQPYNFSITTIFREPIIYIHACG